MPPEWMNRITSHEEDPLWTAGWIPLEPQDHRQQAHPFHGHGCWAGLEPIAPQQHNSWAFTLDATPSTYDDRDQMWVFGLCVHTMNLGQLQRLGALTGVASGEQTKTRALIAGVVALAKFTTTPVRVIVQLTTVWEAWHQPRSRPPYQDLMAEITEQDLARITVLYVSRNTRTPEAPGNEPQLRRRQRDCALAAWERARTFQDHRQTEWQATLDADHHLIYTHAVQRLSKIYDDPEHYIHQKAPRHQGKMTKDFKRDLVNRCTKPWVEPHHRWQPHRSGFQCMACGTGCIKASPSQSWNCGYKKTAHNSYLRKPANPPWHQRHFLSRRPRGHRSSRTCSHSSIRHLRAPRSINMEKPPAISNA